MPKKNSPDKAKILAVIDIGSSELRLKIAQDVKGKYKLLDSLIYPLSLGRDTYDTGKISFEKVDKACSVIQNFLAVTKEYGVSEVTAVATTSLREATNKDYILDQLRIRTGLDIRVLDDYEEKRYIKRIMYATVEKKYLKSALMVYMGSGNIGISILEDGHIPYMQNIKIGSLRINELFENIEQYSTEFHTVVEEYLSSITDSLETKIPDDLKYLITSGHEIATIGALCGAAQEGGDLLISKESFIRLYDEIKFKSVNQIVEDYNLPFEKADVLFSSMCIYNSLIRYTHSDVIIAPLIFLSDAILFKMLYPQTYDNYCKEFDKNTLIHGRMIAKTFNVMESHVNQVEAYAVKIFDKMKKIHGLKSRERLLLQMSALLHDIGKFVNIKSHYLHSYHLISGLDIVGFNMAETMIVANIAYYHSRITPSLDHENYRELSRGSRVTVSKLCAILRLADALVRGGEQKYKDMDVKFQENELVITVSTDKNIDLEQWVFEEKRQFFEEVFGIKAILKKKKVL